MPDAPEDVRAWVEARVRQYGTVDAAKPENLTREVWRRICKHYGITVKKVDDFEEALKEVAALARS